MENIASLLLIGEAELVSAGVPDARMEASSLLAAALECDRTFLIAHPEDVPQSQSQERYHEFITRRAGREPFHYITGVKEFYGLEFTVSPAVLVPRPETEMLAERSIELLRGLEEPRFCEVGVGSACISVAVLVNVGHATGVGLDISDRAIEVARRNAERHGVEERFEIRHSDLFASIDANERFDLIVSNPPYVPIGDVPGLQAEVRDHEPIVALTGGEDGLSVVRRLVTDAPLFLTRRGILMFEFGYSQAPAVLEMFASASWESATIESDLQGIPRIVIAKLGDS